MNLSIRSTLLALAILGVAVAASAQDFRTPETSEAPQDTARFTEARMWAGQATLKGRSDFWDDNFQNFDASRSKLGNPSFGFDWIDHLDPHNAVMLSMGFYLNTINKPARNVLDDSGNPLEHHLDLNTISLTASYVLYPAGTQHGLIPYLGGGAGLYAGQLQSYRTSFTTDNCDEDGNCTTEFVDSRSSNFATFGYFALAGLEVPVSPHVALFAEGRYTVAHANLGGDFKDNSHLDLSGQQVTGGLAIRF
jgi:opacity protein-like surface antigen